MHAGKVVEKGNPSALLVGMQTGVGTMENSISRKIMEDHMHKSHITTCTCAIKSHEKLVRKYLPYKNRIPPATEGQSLLGIDPLPCFVKSTIT